MPIKSVSFLVSGRGSNFSVVAEKIKKGEIPAKLGILISDKADAKALDMANEFGMESYFVNPKNFKTREEHEREMCRLLKKAGTDLVVAAGYMRLLTSYFIREYRNRIINIHPALLPAFPGVNAQKQAFDYGVKIAGCTTHFVDEGTDSGPIILQSAVPVLPDDTLDSLSIKILREEYKILPESVRLFCEGKLKVSGRSVKISR